ncbi:hypothetical protein BC829DRAFT_215014 [Chytridium lagenaria]|nr:hypothetical protein BC829DRAFT_215014 [Chytridium lagenaria]
MVSSKRTVFSSVKLFALIVMLALISPLVHAQAIIYDRSFADMSANLDAAFRNIPDPTGEINIRLQQIHSVADFTPVDVGALNFLLGTLRAGNIDSTATAALDQFTTRINEALANPTATIPPNPNGPATQPPAPAPSPSGGATAAPSTGGSTDTPPLEQALAPLPTLLLPLDPLIMLLPQPVLLLALLDLRLSLVQELRLDPLSQRLLGHSPL